VAPVAYIVKSNCQGVNLLKTYCPMYSLANRRTAGWRRRSLFNVCDLPKGLSSAGWRRHQPFDVCDLAKRLLPGSGQFYKPTEVSRQLLQVPSGNRRPQRTGVCASRRRISQVVDSLEHGILRSAQRVATVNSSCELTVGSLHRNLQKPTVRRALTVATLLYRDFRPVGRRKYDSRGPVAR
jgi:hypothetical protein